MEFSITIGAWIVPAFLTVAVLWWFYNQDYSGDYNFTAAFTAPLALAGICFVWMLYFGIGWWLS